MKAKAVKYLIIVLLMASLFIVTTTFVNAEPVIDHVNGTWSDSFSEPNATAGIAEMYNITVSDGDVNLTTGNSTGNLTSIAITPSSLIGWGKFFANDTINATQGTNITYKILNATDNSTLCTVTSTQANAGYDLSSNASGVSSIRLYANLTTSDTAYTPALHGWNVSWIAPPKSITNLRNTTGNFWIINWTWDNPPNADFSHVMVYINGSWQTNVSKPLNYFKDSYAPHATKTISTHTVDTSGNINETWVNQTTTIPNNNPVLELIGAQEVNETETLMIDVNAIDLDNDTLTYSCNRTDLFEDFNTTTGTGSWTPLKGKAGVYYVDFGVYDGHGGVDNETVKITVIDAPPVISNVTATNIIDISATIIWDTDEISDSMVEYGTEPGNYTLTASNATPVLNHSIALFNLSENTTYYYVVNSTDVHGNSKESSEYNFTTLTLCLSLSAYPQSIEVGGSSSVIIANVTYNNHQPCRRGVDVTFTTTLGYFWGTWTETAVATTNNSGIANVTLISSTESGTATINGTADSLFNTTFVKFVAGAPEYLTVSANPKSVTVGENSTITANVMDDYGNPVENVTVSFNVTIGNGTLSNLTNRTDVNGTAIVILTVDTIPGINRVEVKVDSLTGHVDVTGTVGDPYYLLLDANPQVLYANGINGSTVTATVLDKFSNPIGGKDVKFITPDKTITLPTDLSGQAFIVLLPSIEIQNVTINATVNGLMNTTTVSFIGGPPRRISVKAEPTVLAVQSMEGTNESKITATLTDEWYHGLHGFTVNFATSAGNLSSNTATTSAHGKANVTLSSSNTPETATINATYNNLSASTTVRFSDKPFLNVTTKIDPEEVDVDELPAGVNVTHWIVGEGPIAIAPVDVVHVLDRSGSMRWDTPTRLSCAKAAAKTFNGLLGMTTRVGLVSYSGDGGWYGTTTLDNHLTSDVNAVNSSIDSLSAEGATDIGDAIKLATDEIKDNGRNESVKVELLLTDGVANRPNGNGNDECTADIEYAFAKAQDAADNHIIIFTIGLGNPPHVNETMLQHIANITGGKYFHAPNGTQLQEIYSEIYEEIAKIAGQTQTNILLPGVNITGTPVYNATYVNDSTSIIFTPRDGSPEDISFEPSIILSGDNQIIRFNITKPIDIGDEIVLSYRLLVNGTGMVIGESNITSFEGEVLATFGPEWVLPTGGGGGEAANNPPIVEILGYAPKPAVITAPDKNISVTLNGTYKDPDGDNITKIWWSFGDGNIDIDPTELPSNGTTNVTHIYNKTGTYAEYNVSLNATDKGGDTSLPDYMEIVVMTQPNTVKVSADPKIILTNSTSNITARVTNAGVNISNVNVSFITTLGTLSNSSLSGVTMVTNTTDINGFARVTLASGSIAGYATITATDTDYGGSGSATVRIRARGAITLE
jgi:Mg-chelatase subunit ChlD